MSMLDGGPQTHKQPIDNSCVQHLIKINLNNQQSLVYFRLEQAQP